MKKNSQKKLFSIILAMVMLLSLVPSVAFAGDTGIQITYSECTHGTVAGVANANEGDTVTITATPSTGFKVAKITVNGTEITGNTFTMGAEPATVYAVFIPDSDTVPVKLYDKSTGMTDAAKGTFEIDFDALYRDISKEELMVAFPDLFVDKTSFDSIYFAIDDEGFYLDYFVAESQTFSWRGRLSGALSNGHNNSYAIGRPVKDVIQPSQSNGFEYAIGYNADETFTGTNVIYEATLTKETCSPDDLRVIITYETPSRTIYLQGEDSYFFMPEEYGLSDGQYTWYKCTLTPVTKMEEGKSYCIEFTGTMPLSGKTVTSRSNIFTYIPLESAITYNTCTHGTITGIDKAKAGDTVTVTATPSPLYKLDKIFVNGAEITGNTFTMPSADATVTATFKIASDNGVGAAPSGEVKDTRIANDYTFSVFGRAIAIQLTDAYGNTWTFPRTDAKGRVNIASYNDADEQVGELDPDIVYENWKITQWLPVGEYTIRAKYGRVWDNDNIVKMNVQALKTDSIKIYSYELEKEDGWMGAVPVTVVAGTDVEAIQIVTPADGSITTRTFTESEGQRTFTSKAIFRTLGDNTITVRAYYECAWHTVGELTYNVHK